MGWIWKLIFLSARVSESLKKAQTPKTSLCFSDESQRQQMNQNPWANAQYYRPTEQGQGRMHDYHQNSHAFRQAEQEHEAYRAQMAQAAGRSPQTQQSLVGHLAGALGLGLLISAMMLNRNQQVQLTEEANIVREKLENMSEKELKELREKYNVHLGDHELTEVELIRLNRMVMESKIIEMKFRYHQWLLARRRWQQQDDRDLKDQRPKPEEWYRSRQVTKINSFDQSGDQDAKSPTI